MEKNILIIGSTSELAIRTIEELKNSDFNIYATSRHFANIMDKKVQEFVLDVTKEADFIHLKERFKNIQFDAIVNFAGIAVAGAVEELNEKDLKLQLDVNLFGLLKIIKYFAPNLSKNGRLINVSSMASYGIFPFLSPYCLSKASSDILLNSYSIESNKKVISIRPGAVATKFWESSIELNKECLKQDFKADEFDTVSANKNDEIIENCKFKKEKEFLVKNAQKNSLHAMNPIYAAKKIAKIIKLKNPKAVYNIGIDAKIAKLTRFLPSNFVNCLIKFILKRRIK